MIVLMLVSSQGVRASFKANELYEFEDDKVAMTFINDGMAREATEEDLKPKVRKVAAVLKNYSGEDNSFKKNGHIIKSNPVKEPEAPKLSKKEQAAKDAKDAKNKNDFEETKDYLFPKPPAVPVKPQPRGGNAPIRPTMADKAKLEKSKTSKPKEDNGEETK